MTGSPNFNDRGDTPIDMLVLHYTGMQSASDALDRLCDPASEVSAHYMIDEDGTVHRLVEESARAWHAGVASWRGDANINSRSIGIELVNPGHEFGYRHFPDVQIGALIELCHGILARHYIPARNVIGHSDVAPTRKEDPGELFPWEKLAANGIGVWPADTLSFEPASIESIPGLLTDIGYDVADLDAAVRAFQRHFVVGRLGAGPDDMTRRLLAAVVALL